MCYALMAGNGGIMWKGFHFSSIFLVVCLVVSGCQDHENKLKKADILEAEAKQVFLFSAYYSLFVHEQIAPATAEEDSFNKRKDAEGRVYVPLDVTAFKYSIESLKTWSDRGDPVATYLLAYKSYQHRGCSDYKNTMKLLERAYAVRDATETDDPNRKRVPEAAVVMLGLSSQCNKGDEAQMQAYRDMAYSGGFIRLERPFPTEG
ncbi:MAG: hypothetical protein QM645_10600 [Asticcacaulis sp.]